MIPVLMAVCLLAGIGVGWLAKRHRLGLLAENNHWLSEDSVAIKGADLLADVAAMRSHVITDPSIPVMNPGQACTAYVASILGRYTLGRWRIKGPMDAVPLAREAVGALLHIPEGRLILREALAATASPELSDIDPDEPFDDAELLGPDQLADLRDQAPDYAGWAEGISVDPTVEHLGQACGWPDGDTDCGDPAEGWAQWPDGEPVWLCATHFQWVRASDDHETLPRVLPEGRISD